MRVLLYVLLIPFITFLKAFGQELNKQSTTSCRIYGRCYDYSTAVGIQASVFAITEQGRIELAECKADGKFDVLLPTSAIKIELTMKGYQTNTIPVHFTDDIPPYSKFSVHRLVAMARVDSLPVPPGKGSTLSIYFDYNNNNEAIVYKLTSLTKSTDFVVAPLLNGRTRPKSVAFEVTPGQYNSDVTTTDGRKIKEDKVKLGPGITFKSIRIVNADKPILAPKNSNNETLKSYIPTTVSVYFDQSSYELRSSAKNTLDSIAGLLSNQPALSITLTGYTDNVGSRQLNVALSEYRAKVVENYMVQHGIIPTRIKARWNGPDDKALPEDLEDKKIKSRRVVLQFSTN